MCPYVPDDEFGSRATNPMERCHITAFYIDEAGDGERVCYGTRAVR